ncbi:hypothetical protein GGI23_003321 [Coemansia sp. RSA 2559]|nr:hypothetical protein GGI23_003321 [Coemansia sp. RSA 2559]
MYTLLPRLLSIALLTALLVAGAPMPQAGPGDPASATAATLSSSATDTTSSAASSSSSSEEPSTSPSSSNIDSGGPGSSGVSSTQIYYILAISACAAGFIGFVITLILRRRRRRRLMLAAGFSEGGGGGGLYSHVVPPRNTHHQRAPHNEKIVLSEEQFNMLPHTVVEKGSVPAMRKRSISALSMLSSKDADAGSDEKKHSSAADDEPESCIICLCEYIAGEKVVNLVPCNHMFHSECAFRWLTQKSTTCPLCKADMLEGLELKRPKSVYNDAEATSIIAVHVEDSEPGASPAIAEHTQLEEQMPAPPPPAHVRQDNAMEGTDRLQHRS